MHSYFLSIEPVFTYSQFIHIYIFIYNYKTQNINIFVCTLTKTLHKLFFTKEIMSFPIHKIDLIAEKQNFIYK